MDVWLILFALGSREDNLKAQASRRHCRNRDSHGVYELAMELFVVMWVLASYPALKVRDIAL